MCKANRLKQRWGSRKCVTLCNCAENKGKVRLREPVPVGEEKTCWCKFGVLLGRRMIGGMMLNVTLLYLVLLHTVWTIPSVMLLLPGSFAGSKVESVFA